MDLSELVRLAEEESPEDWGDFRVRILNPDAVGEFWTVDFARFDVSTGELYLAPDTTRATFRV